MKPFWFAGQRMFNHWLVEQRDIGTAHLLAQGVEHTINHTDVGLLYVVDSAKGDRLDVAPQEPDDDDEGLE